MKITRRQLRKLISEVYASTPEGDSALRVGQRAQAGISPKTIGDLEYMGKDDPETAYDLASALGSKENPPIQNLEADLPFEMLLSSRNPQILQTLGFVIFVDFLNLTTSQMVNRLLDFGLVDFLLILVR